MDFDPPLDRWERRAIWLWWLVSGTAAAGMLFGVFWWWVIFILTIPFVFAAYFAPTVWLYLTPALLAWLLLRHRPRWGLSAAAGAVALVAIGVPVLINARIDSLIFAVSREQTGAPVSLRGVRAVALLDDYFGSFCSYGCERFFVTGRADTVLIGLAGTAPLDPARLLTRVRKLPSGGKPCPLPAKDHMLVRDALRFAPEFCLVFDSARLDSADIVVIDARSPIHRGMQRLPQLPFVRRVQQVVQVRDRRLVTLFRRSRGSGNYVGIPLSLWPYSGADTPTSAFWGKGAAISTGPELPLGLEGLFVESLFVTEFDTPQ